MAVIIGDIHGKDKEIFNCASFGKLCGELVGNFLRSANIFWGSSFFLLFQLWKFLNYPSAEAKHDICNSLFITGFGIPVRLMWELEVVWKGRESGKRCNGECVSEREGMNSVVNTVIVWIGNVAGVWVELLKAIGGKRAVVASVKDYKVDTCGVRGRERKTARESE